MNPLDLMDGHQIVDHVAAIFGGKNAAELSEEYERAARDGAKTTESLDRV